MQARVNVVILLENIDWGSILSYNCLGGRKFTSFVNLTALCLTIRLI